MTPRVLFLTGGGVQSGFGHVRRCLSLAQALAARQVQSLFRLHGSGLLADIVAGEGFGVSVVGVGASDDAEQTRRDAEAVSAALIVVDSYDFNSAFIESLASCGPRTAVIDDLADRSIPADVVINGALGAELLQYHGAPHTQFLLGSNYSLLRHEYAAPPTSKHRDAVCRVLVTPGGSDPHGLTVPLIAAALDAGAGEVDVIAGPLFEPTSDKPSNVPEQPGIHVHHFPVDMYHLMTRADVALSAGGQTLYELAATATPAIAVRTASNQTSNLEAFAAAGLIQWVGDASDAKLTWNVSSALRHLMADSSRREAMGAKARRAVDGRGAERVARALCETMETRA